MSRPYPKSERIESRQRSPERKSWHQQLRWGDFLITGIVALLAIGLLLSAPRSLAGQARTAVLSEDGRTVFSKSTTELQTAGQFTLEANGYHFVMAYESGRIRFAKADCPDQVCVRTGWVERNGQVAACVPGHLILKITGPAAPGGNDIDIIMQ